MNQKDDRRTFIKKGLATAAGIGILSNTKAITQAEKLAARISSNTMPKRKLGKTGHNVSILGLGGESTIQRRDKRDEAIEIINRAIDLGVNYIDTSAVYGNGGSEKNIGDVMKDRRSEVFLATKSHDYTYDGTMQLFEQSLENLQTDYVDLYQVHALSSVNRFNRLLRNDGALKAFEQLKNEGSVRNIGVTGHFDPSALKHAIEHYNFDCILMTLNAADIHYLPFQYDLLDTAVKMNLGIIAMKVVAKGAIFRNDGITSMEQAFGYVCSFPISTAILGITTLEELEENVEVARNFHRYNEQEMHDITQLTAHYYQDASSFKM